MLLPVVFIYRFLALKKRNNFTTILNLKKATHICCFYLNKKIKKLNTEMKKTNEQDTMQLFLFFGQAVYLLKGAFLQMVVWIYKINNSGK